MTAIEWLVEILELSNISNQYQAEIEQAKEMEKQQIFDACYFGHLKGWVDDGVENSYAEQYYDEKFKI